MNETRRYRVRRELMILANKKLEYEDVERLLGIGACDEQTIRRLKGR